MSDNYRNNFQIIQTFQMKVLQCGSPKSNKLNKRINLPVYAHTKRKQTLIDENEEYLSPIHIKLANQKVKPKNEAKIQKHESSIDDRRTKRKQTKKLSMELNSTIVVNDFLQKKVNKKQQENQKPTKTAEKTQRKTPKSENKKINKNQWLVDSQQKIMRNLMQKKKKKIPLIKQQIPIISNQEYLFISDKFFLVNNLNPAKKLLNTFSQNCKKEHPDSKFITQDKKDRIKQKSMEKKTNIFTEVRKEIELNNKIKKATKIQRWWRRFSTIKNLTKTKPQYVQQQNQQLNISQSKLSFKQREQSQKKSPFQMSQSNSSPIKDKIQNGEDSIIASFHSAEKLIEESLPKKILFTKDDLSKLIVPAYKLPSIQVSADENEAIFSSYAKFKIQQPNNENVSSDLSLLTPPKQQASLITGDQDSFQQQIKDQWSPNKVIDPQIDIINEFQEATRIKEQIEFRAAFQKGIIKPIDTFNSKVGISTSILGIHSFLVNFFNFYIQKYQDQFINLINMPYGHSINARLRSVQGYNLPQQIEQDDQGVVFGVQEIIDQQKLEQFYSNRLQTGKNITNFTKANLQLQKIHNKSVIDLLNELLNQYRPYKQINGIPYPWNHSYKALTFYYVTEDNITQVFEKVQIKILKDSSLLAGIMLPYNQRNQQSVQKAELDTALFTQNYIKNYHPLVYQFNQEKQVKCIHEEIKSDSFEFDNEALTKLLIQISNEIFDQLTLQNASELKDNKIICFN